LRVHLGILTWQVCSNILVAAMRGD
jgi:hypothetical protein